MYSHKFGEIAWEIASLKESMKFELIVFYAPQNPH